MVGFQRGRLMVALAAALVLVGCKKSGDSNSGSTPTSPSNSTSNPAPANSVTVNIVGTSGPQAYQPNPIAAPAGYGLFFKNNDAVTHHIVLDDGADVGNVSPGGTSSAYTVKSTAPMGYHCVIHPSMVGNINAAAAPAPTPDPTPSPNPNPTPTPPPCDPYYEDCGTIAQ